MSSTIISYDPSNGETIGEIALSSPENITAIVENAKLAATKWQLVSVAKRLEYIEKAYKSVEPHLQDLAILLSKEMGKDIGRAMGEVQGTVYGGPYIAQSVAEALTETRIGRTIIHYRPHGIVALISPWNYPLAMANNLLVPSLIAGNSVIWKPSEETPLIAQAFFDLLQESLPSNVLQLVHGDGEQGKQLVNSQIDMVAFTGSQLVGKEIMQAAAGSLKRLVMELGGNDPMIVLADADIQAAARFAVASSFENSGQMCTSTERIYVHEAVAHDFENLVVHYAGGYKVGSWDIDGVNIGPINNSKQHQKIVTHITDALNKGGKLLLGEPDPQPPYVNPTIISGMSQDMLIEQEETFGPLVCISRFSDPAEAITRANNSTYALGAVVFGRDKANEIAQQLHAGMIGINQGVGGEGDSPWVGAKQSGYGFHGSADGHKQFAQVCVLNT